MAPAPLTDAQLKASIEAYNTTYGNKDAAAAALGVAGTTYRNRFRQAVIKFPKLVKVAPRRETGLTLSEEVVRQQELGAGRSDRARLKEAYTQIAALNDKIEKLERANNVSHEPAVWSLQPRKNVKHVHIPYLLVSDMQTGEVIDGDETEAGYDYSPAIFSDYYRRMIDTAIYLSTEHVGKDWNFPGFVYVRGGDAVSGDIHPELMKTQSLTPLQCADLVFEEEAAGLIKLADRFGHVDVKAPGAGGNHDRMTMKPEAKKAYANSFEYYINRMLINYFRRDPRITFQVSKSFDVRFAIFDRNILVTHGDRIGTRGGQGFIGPAATIMRGAQKVIQEQHALGYSVHEIHMGHYHYPMDLPWVLVNGCFPGYSEYGKLLRADPTPPRQTLAFYSAGRGRVDTKPIFLRG